MGITDEENEAIIEFDRLQLLELEAFASGQIRRLEFDEGNKFMIDGRFTRTQPVSLTPGALGVRCEE